MQKIRRVGWVGRLRKGKFVKLGSDNCWCEVGIWCLKKLIVKENKERHTTHDEHRYGNYFRQVCP